MSVAVPQHRALDALGSEEENMEVEVNGRQEMS
jgi:hypothetical protein